MAKKKEENTPKNLKPLYPEGPCNRTDPIVRHDSEYSAGIVAKIYEPQYEEPGVKANSSQTYDNLAVDAIKVPVIKLNNTMERYKILVKQCIDKSEIFIEDTKEEKKRTLVQIQDYILKQLYSETFPPEAGERAININEAELQLPQKDKQLYDKLQKINDIRPEELLVKLDLPEKQINDSINIMKKLDEANSVYEKVSCIHWAYNMICLLLHFITGKEEAGGADDISPIFQYIVIKAKPKRV